MSGNETSVSPRLTWGGPGGNRGRGSACDVGCTTLAGEGGGGPLGASAVAPIISCSNLCVHIPWNRISLKKISPDPPSQILIIRIWGGSISGVQERTAKPTVTIRGLNLRYQFSDYLVTATRQTADSGTWRKAWSCYTVLNKAHAHISYSSGIRGYYSPWHLLRELVSLTHPSHPGGFAQRSYKRSKACMTVSDDSCSCRASSPTLQKVTFPDLFPEWGGTKLYCLAPRLYFILGMRQLTPPPSYARSRDTAGGQGAPNLANQFIHVDDRDVPPLCFMYNAWVGECNTTSWTCWEKCGSSSCWLQCFLQKMQHPWVGERF